MNQVKIGKFIQGLRKEKKMTQLELADKLNISDKTVSKWETGNGMPDLVFLKPLSEILGITINELLSGERLSKSNYQEKFEENIINTIDYTENRIKQKNNKLGIILLVFGLLMIVTSITIFSSESSWRAWYSVLGSIVSLVGVSKFTKEMTYCKRVLINFVFYIICIVILFLLDYINVRINNVPPAFSLNTETKNTTITYKTPFYNVYRCNKGTTNEYYEIDYSKKKAECTNPFDPNKSDISRIIKYKNKYLGNNSNTVNLYYSLPLSNYGFTLEIDSNNLGITINYNSSEFYINEDNNDVLFVKKSLIYNAISSFVLIDNLTYINYNFSGTSYLIKKDDVILNYDSFNRIEKNNNIDESNFNIYVTKKISNDQFINDTFDNLFIKK